MRRRIAIVATHPIQYYAPWFAQLAAHSRLDVKVFYLWDFGVRAQMDPGFQVPVQWDIPLLDGYAHEFVPNVSCCPGTKSFFGLCNPELSARLRAWEPEAILLTAYNYASIAALVVGRGARGMNFMFRGDSHRLLPRRGAVAAIKQAMVTAFFKRMGAVLYVGKANRDYFRMHGVADDRLFLAPHAVDNDRFFAARAAAEAEAPAWRSAVGIPADHRVVLFAGKFEHKKRPLDLLRAFVLARLERTSLIFVGAGVLEDVLRAEAACLGDVFFVPFQNQLRMPLVYAAADVFVLPSYGPDETWGLAVNEAMCMGRPVIVSDHVGCARDLVLPGETGLVFRAGDVDALASALRIAFDKPCKLLEWGMKAAVHVQAFSYERATAGLLAALDFLYGRGR